MAGADARDGRLGFGGIKINLLVVMSRSRRGGKGGGYDFWSRRSGVGGSGPVSKAITKKQERTRDRQIERMALVDPDQVPGRLPGE